MRSETMKSIFDQQPVGDLAMLDTLISQLEHEKGGSHCDLLIRWDTLRLFRLVRSHFVECVARGLLDESIGLNSLAAFRMGLKLPTGLADMNSFDLGNMLCELRCILHGVN